MDIQSLYPTEDNELDPTIQWELGRFAQLDLLREGEVLCEVEKVWRRRGWGRGLLGALLLTDLRLIFISTNVIVRRPRVELWELPMIENVEVFDSPRWGERGAIRVTFDRDEDGKPVELEQIDGGTNRATELVASIERQARLLAT